MEHLAGQRQSQTLAPMLYYARGSKDDCITGDEVRDILARVFGSLGERRKVLAIPPDFTRFNSYAGPITEMVYD